MEIAEENTSRKFFICQIGLDWTHDSHSSTLLQRDESFNVQRNSVPSFFVFCFFHKTTPPSPIRDVLGSFQFFGQFKATLVLHNPSYVILFPTECSLVVIGLQNTTSLPVIQFQSVIPPSPIENSVTFT